MSTDQDLTVPSAHQPDSCVVVFRNPWSRRWRKFLTVVGVHQAVVDAGAQHLFREIGSEQLWHDDCRTNWILGKRKVWEVERCSDAEADGKGPGGQPTPHEG
jgi:hypothetical protein